MHKRPPSLQALRAHAVARTLRPASSVADAVSALRFVQLDPIRAPARAADLILRQRVDGYRAGDLDRAYPTMPLAEDFIHVYGVLPASTLSLLHPRRVARRHVELEHPRLSARVLAHVERHGETHPRDLASLGTARTVNGWGGASTATTRVLEALHHHGRLRVARRVNGIKLYDVARPLGPPVPAAERAHALLAMLIHLYAPLPESTFRHLAYMVTDSSLSPTMRVRTVERLRKGSDVMRIDVADTAWLLPAGEPLRDDVDDRVRLLAPFDPIVWDRRRFATFWNWEYRLEAYTPPRKRKFGYYALPLLVARRRRRLGQRGRAGRRPAHRGSLCARDAAYRDLPARTRRRDRTVARVCRRHARRRAHWGRMMRVGNSTLFLTATAIWGSTWLAIKFQLGSRRAAGVGRLSLRAGERAPGALVRGDRRIAALSAPRARVPGAVRRHVVRLQLCRRLPGRAIRGVGPRCRRVLDDRVHESGRDAHFAFGTPLDVRASWSRRRWACVGVALLFVPEIDAARHGGSAAAGIAFGLGATVIATIGNLVAVRNHNAGLPTFPATAWGMGYGALSRRRCPRRCSGCAGPSSRLRRTSPRCSISRSSAA